MTEKRFQYNVNKNTIEQDGKFVAYMNSVDGVRIANKLNVLQNENEQLKEYKQKVAKAFKVAIKETTLTEQTENSLRAISKILEVDLVDEVHNEDITDLIKELQE